jgi:transporter family protein
MISIGTGTYLMITKKKQDVKITAGNRWLLYAVLSTVFASLTSILAKIGIKDIESNLGTAIRTIVVFVMAWIIVFVTGKYKEIAKIDKKSLGFICFSGITTGLSWLCYYRALQDGQASIVVPIDKLSILVTIAFSFFFLKEKMTRKSVSGLGLMVIGTLLLLIK